MKTMWNYDLQTDRPDEIARRLVDAARSLPEQDNDRWSILLRSVAEFESKRGQAAKAALDAAGWYALIGA